MTAEPNPAPGSLDWAVQVLNEHEHRDTNRWYTAGPPANRIATAPDTSKFLTSFEALAIARAYEPTPTEESYWAMAVANGELRTRGMAEATRARVETERLTEERDALFALICRRDLFAESGAGRPWFANGHLWFRQFADRESAMRELVEMGRKRLETKVTS